MEKSRLFVGGLPEEATEDELRRLFSEVGEVQHVSIIIDRGTGKRRGFGFVQMGSEAEAQIAIDRLHGFKLHTRKLRVLIAEPKIDKTATAEVPQLERPNAEPVPEPAAPTFADPPITAQPSEPEPEPAPRDSAAPEPLTPHPEPRPTGFKDPTPFPFSGGGFLEKTPVPSPPRRWRTLIPFVLFLVLIAVGATLFVTRPPKVQPEIGTVLVLPLEVYGDDGADSEYLGFAFAQALAVNLAPVKDLKVLPVPSASELEKVDSKQRAQLALARGAGRLIVGSIRRGESSTHVSMTLIEPLEERIIWGVQRDVSGREILAIAADLAHEIGGQLGVTFPKMYAYVTDLTGPPEMESSPLRRASVAALRRSDLDASLTATERLVAAFPAEPAALALQALAQIQKWDARRTRENRSALEATLEKLDATGRGYPYSDFFRTVLLYDSGKDREAVDGFTKLLENAGLAPAAQAWVLRYRAFGRQRLGELEGSLADLNKSLELDPTNAVTLGILSSALTEAGRAEEAVTRARQGLALAPSLWRTHHAHGMALLALERHEQAAVAFSKACDLAKAQLPCSLGAIALVKAKKVEQARQTAAAAAKQRDSAWGTYNLACYWALVGDTEASLAYLEKAVALGLNASTIETDSDLESVRSDPRFVELVAKIKSK